MIKCNLCWCKRVASESLGCKLKDRCSKKKMPCGFYEMFMIIMVDKVRADAKLRSVIKEIELGIDLEKHGIDALSKEVVDLLKSAEGKMFDLLLAYQKTINECQKDCDTERGGGLDEGKSVDV